jgi:hypothetical protein
MISLRPQIDLSLIIKEIAEIKNVTRIIKAFGDYDLLIIAATKDFIHMFETGKKIEKIEGVIKIEARPYLPLSDPQLPISAPYGFFNPDLLDNSK